MKPWGTVFLFASVMLLVARTLAEEPHGDLRPLPYFAAEQPGQPMISSDIMAQKPFSVTGPRGALLGQQDGSFEAWIFPWKIVQPHAHHGGYEGLRRTHRRE